MGSYAVDGTSTVGGSLIAPNFAFTAADNLEFPYTFDGWRREVGKVWPDSKQFESDSDILNSVSVQNFTTRVWRVGLWRYPGAEQDSAFNERFLAVPAFDKEIDPDGGSMTLMHDRAVTLDFTYEPQGKNNGPTGNISFSTEVIELQNGSGTVLLTSPGTPADRLRPIQSTSIDNEKNVIRIDPGTAIYHVKVVVSKDGRMLHKPILIPPGRMAILKYQDYYWAAVIKSQVRDQLTVMTRPIKLCIGYTAGIFLDDSRNPELRALDTLKYAEKGLIKASQSTGFPRGGYYNNTRGQ